MNEQKLTQSLIAPCGMNCGLCKAHLRSRNSCPGCQFITAQDSSKFRARCFMRLCTKRKGKFCFRCKEFPCAKLKHLDERYRKKYSMSEIENLIYIRENGIRKFIARERERWCSESGVYCVHDTRHYQ